MVSSPRKKVWNHNGLKIMEGVLGGSLGLEALEAWSYGAWRGGRRDTIRAAVGSVGPGGLR